MQKKKEKYEMWFLYLLQTWCCLDPFWVGMEQSKLCCHFRSNMRCGLGQPLHLSELHPSQLEFNL